MGCPYSSLPASSWWSQTMDGRTAAEIDPHRPSSITIAPATRITSAGSCFAQNISRALVERGYNYFVTEQAPAFMSAEKARNYNYGVFSARYGNIYSTIQLLQLLQRATGSLTPADQYWSDDDGRYYDLLRPRIVPKGFASRAEAEADNRQHLAAVRRLFQEAEVFIFTLGLTESWRSCADGTVYPTCPGCGSAGDYDPEKYRFENLTVEASSAALSSAIKLLRELNPSLHIILTVSPVPLIATMTNTHVLQATTYSKSVLRVVAEQTVQSFENVHYFGSYEIITATRNTHAYFENDGRTVTEAGVGRAMELFFAHFAGEAPVQAPTSRPAVAPTAQEASDLICDEKDFFRAMAKSAAN
ncbi:GSCFA domain-containing protein [Bradyrhizobium sp. RT3a]|uniref:GSCFA domain-containing protein n=1 Tax=unclassified Bradyrhizobium TaxID=2631580 RepID=UPI0033986053